MSSDGYFDGEDDFNADALAQIDAIEAVHFSPKKHTGHSTNNRSRPPTNEDSFDDISFNVNESELRKLDAFIKESYEGNPAPIAGPSRTFARTASNNMVQTTLFGGVAGQQPTSNTNKARPDSQRTTTTTPRNIFGQQARKTKKWDQTAFAKSGTRPPKSKDKGKGRADDEDGLEDEPLEFEQFPAPFVSRMSLNLVREDRFGFMFSATHSRPPPMKLVPDLLEAKHWIYPINLPKRDYQHNIIKHCFFDNTLVALPTGLGKTFIAGVIMLNFYRWFPEGKVVFVAPTKPLVAQQVIACHETCGIPTKDSIELTGEVVRSTRIRYWSEKRVFFMTPQTLVNDLVKETCDARDIVLLVVDEAHRATGNYAYNQAIRFLMAKNPHFRVLALTATPGNDPKTVQTVIDGLHISRIEIRNEESLDLKPYIHRKTFVPHIIKANPAVAKLRDLLVSVMNPLMKPMRDTGILRPNELAVSLHPYRPQALMRELKDKRFLGPLAMLGKLARAMLYLLTGSIEACYQFLCNSNDQDTEAAGDANKKAKGRKLKDDLNFRILMQELERQKVIGFALHPKMEEMLNVLIQHFGQSEEGDETRVMVFSSYRAVVDRIVEELSKHEPLLRAARFIGQGTDKHGNKGLAQREQHEVIQKFQAGTYNILVATSIGEEGLDIGEIDVTICYDADKAPTRMIQRFGRTGRKRDGTIHALLSEEREELNIEKAESTYREVQKQITKGELYELYGDVERLIPDHIKPECIEKTVEIQQYVRETKSPKKKAADTHGTKRKRNDDVMRNIPEGACTGFVSVRDLIAKQAPKPKMIKMSKNFDACGENDETDEDIESGRVAALPRRTQSAAAGSSHGPERKVVEKGRAKLRKSSTIGSKPRKPRKKKVDALTSKPFAKQGLDDSDDMDIEQGAISAHRGKSNRDSRSPLLISGDGQRVSPPNPPFEKATSRILSPTPAPCGVDASVVELTDSEHEPSSHRPNEKPPPSPAHMTPNRSPSPFRADEDMGWIVDDDEDNLQIEIVDSSPGLSESNRTHWDRVSIGDESLMISRPRFNPKIQDYPLKPKSLVDDSTVEIIEPEPVDHAASSPPISIQHPPPEPTYPVRQVKRKRVIIEEAGSSPRIDGPPLLQRRLRRMESTPPKNLKKAKVKRARPTILGNGANPLFDGEAIHSGDEVSEGGSNSEDDVESESDRRFIKDSPLTQVSHSYDQSQIYRRSLMTQFTYSDSRAGPTFAHPPLRPKAFGMAEGRMHYHSGGLPSSSPPPPDDGMDTYEYGSFVVADDDFR